MMCGSSVILSMFNGIHLMGHLFLNICTSLHLEMQDGLTVWTLDQTNVQNQDLISIFLPVCRAVAWKRPVVSHDVWVVRDTIYVQQTSCWLPWHMEKRLTVASSSALFWMFLSIIHGLNVPRLILLNFFFMIVFSLLVILFILILILNWFWRFFFTSNLIIIVTRSKIVFLFISKSLKLKYVGRK